MRLLLYALLVSAFIAMLMQGRRPAAQPAAAAAADDTADPAQPALPAPLTLRFAAAGVDLLPLVLTGGLLTSEPAVSGGAAAGVVVVVGLLVYVLLPLVGELLSGRSPGKALFGLRVVNALDHDGEVVAASSLSILIRNLTRPVDLVGGWVSMFFNPARRRLGDLAAGTRVIYDPVRTPIRVDPAD